VSEATFAAPAASKEPAKPAIPRAAWITLAACTAAAALLQLDGTLITVALPSVAHGLKVKGSTTSAVLSTYFGAYALLLIRWPARSAASRPSGAAPRWGSGARAPACRT
jgi:hypothetical protein